jgi:large subunit ribosomal protein L9
MKVVLRQDVPKLGEAGTVQNVSGGYARNFLVPQGLAVYATEGELKMAAHNQAVKDRKVARQEEQLRSLAEKIEGQALTFEARAGEGGRLFGSVTAAEIAEQLSAKVGEEIDRRRVQLEEPIRTTGQHAVTVHLVGRLRPSITVTVNPDADSVAETSEEATEADSTEETTEA